MIDRVLAGWVRLSRRRPGLIALLVLASVSSSAYVWTVPVDLSFAGLMNRSHPEVERYFAASEAYGLGGLLLLLVEGPEERLDEVVAQIRDALRALPEVKSTDGDDASSWLSQMAPWLVEDELLRRWLDPANAPFGPGDDSTEPLVFDRPLRTDEPWQMARPAGARLVRIEMASDTFELALDSKDFPTIRGRTEEIVAVHDASARFAGMPAIITQEQEATLERMRWLGPMSLVLVLAILGTVERRPAILLSIALPMLLSIGCTLALVGAIAGEFTLMESIFGVLVFGLGIDFALHLLLRLREEQGAGGDFDESLGRAFVGTGRGVLAGGSTTAGAFLVLSLAPDPVFHRLGLSGGIGLSLCLVFLLTFLPAQWAFLDGRGITSPLARRSASSSRFGWIAAWAARAPKIVLGGAAVTLLCAMIALPQLSYETDLTRVFSREIDAVETSDRIASLFGVHPGVWLASAKSLDEARRIARDLSADPLFERSESLADFLPGDPTGRARLLGELTRSQAVAGETDGVPKVSAELRGMLVDAASAGPPTIETLPKSIRDRFQGPNGEFLVWAYTREARLDSAAAARERRAAQAISPGATSMNVIYEALIGTDRPWLPPILAGVVLFVAALLRLDLGSFRRASLALVPALFSLATTLGILAVAGLELNTVTLVAFPLLLGLGVDDGIHVVHRMIEQPGTPTGEIVGSVSRSIALTTATTCGSVALLLLSRHPGIESVALVLLVGLPIALVSTLTVVPALAIVMGVHARS